MQYQDIYRLKKLYVLRPTPNSIVIMDIPCKNPAQKSRSQPRSTQSDMARKATDALCQLILRQILFFPLHRYITSIFIIFILPPPCTYHTCIIKKATPLNWRISMEPVFLQAFLMPSNNFSFYECENAISINLSNVVSSNISSNILSSDTFGKFNEKNVL